MKIRTKSTDERLIRLIEELKKKSFENKARIWRAVAEMLNKPRSRRRIVNISRISRYTKQGDVVVVPGKVLGSGSISHSVTVAAFAFSRQAKEKITKAGGRCITILELVEENPKGSNVKIIG